ncbi:AraC family transcriptional regulator [Enterococcus sp. 2201sp1_2201st1_B8_2201SCRN_220225]|uniref:helix-turn-helix transcriptional regulator n=1 Tax=unclassified Enterococcus TaxID=2608891 RepID=UPI0034A4C671
MSNYIFTPNPSEKDINQQLKEISEHGNSLFPFAVHFTRHQTERTIAIHTHWHREMEILYILNGELEVTVERRRFLAEEGDILFIPPNLIHGATKHQKSNCAFFALVFDPYFIESHLSDTIQQSYFDPIINHSSQHIIHANRETPNIEALRNHVSEMIESFALKENHFELSLKAHMFFFFKELYSEKDLLFRYDHSQERKNEITSYKCKKILLYMEENYQKRITLNDISEYMGYSREHFCRFFKKNFKMSFFSYLNIMRIRKAEYLLLNTQLKIIDIALECGFEDPNYFTTVFKAETNLTPSAYRNTPDTWTRL